MNKLFALFLCSILPLTLIKADTVTINFQGDQVTDSSNIPLVDGSLVLLLANVATPTTSGAGFGTIDAGTLNIGDVLNGQYQILGRGEVDQFDLPGEFSAAASAISLQGDMFPNLSTGDQLAVVWFSTLSASSDYLLPAGTSYGLYTVDDDVAWEVPVGGTVEFDVTVPRGSKAMQTVAAVPEPATWTALAGLGVLAWAIKFRRHAVAK